MIANNNLFYRDAGCSNLYEITVSIGQMIQTCVDSESKRQEL